VSAFLVQVALTSEWEWARGQYLQGPRTPQKVARDGYGVTTDISNAWPFDSIGKATQKARIFARHMKLPEKDVCAVPRPDETPSSNP
jgi:hypothetical protein